MKVYFNNSCKICKAEIDLYKKEKIQEIDWVDITNNDLAEKETSKSNNFGGKAKISLSFFIETVIQK